MNNIICCVLYLQVVVLVCGRRMIENIKSVEQGKYLIGDMLISKGQLINGIIDETKRWPGGIIPYKIRGNFNVSERNNIHKAAKTFQEISCLRWVPRTNQVSYVDINRDREGCSSEVGYHGRVQTLNLGQRCIVTKYILHEMMHSVGFTHEHNRPDRDKYVTIVYQNIKPDCRSSFYKQNKNEYIDFGFAYDYESIMHYEPNSCSLNGGDTIIPKEYNHYSFIIIRVLATNIMEPEMSAYFDFKFGVSIGLKENLTKTDIKKINIMYHCKK